jgi:hypothetical protein
MRYWNTPDLMGGSAARMGELRNLYITWQKNANRKYCLEDVGVDGRIILKYMGWEGTDWINLA